MSNESGQIPATTTFKQIVFADHAGDFGPTAANDLQEATHTQDGEIQIASLEGNPSAAAIQSDKIDLGTVWAPLYSVRGALEFTSSGLTAGEIMDLFWAPSQKSSAFPGGVSGTKGAFTGYSSNLDDSLEQLEHIGSFIVTTQATATIQIGTFGYYSFPMRHGVLVLVNRSGADMHSDDVEMHIVFDPIILQTQA